jgi:N-methylhydantoinase A
MPKSDLAGQSSAPALKGKREVFLSEAGRFVPIEIYEFDRLRPGNVIAGPAIIEATTTTMFMLSGQVATIDEYKNVRIIEGG